MKRQIRNLRTQHLKNLNGVYTRVKIKSIDPGGLGETIGLRAGDKLLTINGKKIRDIIDYEFNIFEPQVLVRISRKGEVTEYELDKDEEEDLGVNFEDIRYRSCGCKCIFCFVDQNPKGLRKALYFHEAGLTCNV